MKALSIAFTALVTLGLTTPAHAGWDFLWQSTWTGFVFTSNPPDIVSAKTTLTGESIATIGTTPSSLLVDFGSSAGLAQFEVDKSAPGGPLIFNAQFPFDVPAGANGPGSPQMITLLPPHPENFLGSFSWTGSIDDPNTFSVQATMPGSGPAPELVFTGTGTRIPAAEPGTLGIALAALGGTLVLRRRTRLARG